MEASRKKAACDVYYEERSDDLGGCGSRAELRFSPSRWSLLVVVASIRGIQFTMGVEASTKTIEQQVQPDGATVIGLVSNRICRSRMYGHPRGCHKGGTGSVWEKWGVIEVFYANLLCNRPLFKIDFL